MSNKEVCIKVFSCAEWPKETYTNEYGESITKDRHYIGSVAEDALEAVKIGKSICRALDKEGFGGMRKSFPVKVWVEIHSEGPYVVQEKSSMYNTVNIKQFSDFNRAVQSCEAHFKKVACKTRVVLKGTNLRVYPENGDYKYVSCDPSN